MCVNICVCVLKTVVKDVGVNLYTSVYSLPDIPSKTKVSRLENETRVHKGTKR